MAKAGTVKVDVSVDFSRITELLSTLEAVFSELPTVAHRGTQQLQSLTELHVEGGDSLIISLISKDQRHRMRNGSGLL